MSKKNPFGKWSHLQLNADLEMYYARDWAKALKTYEKKPRDFFAAYNFLWYHPANQVRPAAGELHSPHSYFDMNLSVMVVKVDPKTNRVEDKKSRNTKVQIWVEWGPWCTPETLAAEAKARGDWQDQVADYHGGMPSHDPRVDTGGDTYEEAIINLAHNIWVLYKDNADIPNSAKLRKKDRW